MAGYGEMFGTDGAQGMDFGPGIGELGFGQLDASPPPTAMDAPTAPTDDGMSNQTIGAVMGTVQALSGLAGAFGAYTNQKHAAKMGRSALRIKKSQTRINKMLAKSDFDRKMIGLFQSQRDMEEQTAQQHQARDSAYQKSLGSLRVMQAESGMEGTSAAEATAALTRSNLVAEQIMIGNMKKAERSLMYQREGLADQRFAREASAEFQEMGFDMQDANLRAQIQTPAWAQVGMQAPSLLIGGWNTYFSFVSNSGRSQDVI
tara:strand:+ start:338 stop:1117 length:780 start_codon:yes stop_codon:yes gene_type:complete